MDAAVNEADKVPIPRELSIRGGGGVQGRNLLKKSLPEDGTFPLRFDGQVGVRRGGKWEMVRLRKAGTLIFQGSL